MKRTITKAVLGYWITLLAFTAEDAVARGRGRRAFSNHNHSGHFRSQRFDGIVVKDWDAYLAQDDIKSGRARHRILSVQQSLAAQGFYRGPRNGVFDETTRRAIKQFQGSEDLPATGVIDSVTWTALGFRAVDGPQR